MASGSVSEVASLADTKLLDFVKHDGENNTTPPLDLPEVWQYKEDDFTSERRKIGSGGFGVVFKRSLKKFDGNFSYIAEKQMHCGNIQRWEK